MHAVPTKAPVLSVACRYAFTAALFFGSVSHLRWASVRLATSGLSAFGIKWKVPDT